MAKVSNSPRTFSMTLGTALSMLANPDGYRPEKVREARRVKAYWDRRVANTAIKLAKSLNLRGC